MKTKKGSICLLLFTCMMLLAFVAVVPQRANAEDLQTQFEVSDYDDFKEAIATIDEAASGLEEGAESPDFVITLRANITLGESSFDNTDGACETFINLPSNTRLTIQSPQGSRYSINASPLVVQPSSDYADPIVRIFGTSPKELTLQNVTFTGNADLISVNENSKLIMKNCNCEISNREDYITGENNFGDYKPNYGAYIDCYGPAELEKVTFTGQNSQRGKQGLIQILGESFSMKDCEFKNFLCAADSSLICYISENDILQKITAIDCKFANIKFPYGNFGVTGGASAFGGFGNAKTEVTVEGGSFTNCESYSHPAMLLHDTKGTIKGVEFSNNKAVKQGNMRFGDSGGALKIDNCEKTLIENCRFINNYSDVSGGALKIFNSKREGDEVTINGGEFTGNVAEASGGAICAWSSDVVSTDMWGYEYYSYGYLKLKEVELSNNTAENSTKVLNFDEGLHFNNDGEPLGGGAIFTCGYKVHLKEGTVIKGNRAKNNGNGGGVYAKPSGDEPNDVRINCASILQNVADNKGGGIFCGKSLRRLLGRSMRVSFTDGIISENTAREGGGIYLSAGPDHGGSATALEMRPLRYELNDDDDDDDNNWSGGVITSNHALVKGGGVFLEGPSQTAVNNAYGDGELYPWLSAGGAIYHNEAGTVEKPPYNIDPRGAGADIHAEHWKSLDYDECMLMIEDPTGHVELINNYLQNPNNTFVPDKDRGLWFTNWYRDHESSNEDGTTRYKLAKAKDKIPMPWVDVDSEGESYEIEEDIPYPAMHPFALWHKEHNGSCVTSMILARATDLKITVAKKGVEAPEKAEYGYELKISKLPIDDEILRAVITDAEGKTTDTFLELKDGVFSFTLKNDESITISELPVGAEFTLTETDNDNAKYLEASFANLEEGGSEGWTVTGKTRTTWQGSVEDTKLSVVNLVNVYEATGSEEGTPENPTEEVLDEYEAEKQDPKDKTLGEYENDTDKDGKVKGADTGDNTHMIGWIAMLIISSLAAIAVFIRRRCQNN